MLLPEYRDLLNRALALPAKGEDPDDDVVLVLQASGFTEQEHDRADVRRMLRELTDLWSMGTARDQEGFNRYVLNIASGRILSD